MKGEREQRSQASLDCLLKESIRICITAHAGQWQTSEGPGCTADWLAVRREDGQMEGRQPMTVEEHSQGGGACGG